jgi:hypothetical protein
MTARPSLFSSPSPPRPQLARGLAALCLAAVAAGCAPLVGAATSSGPVLFGWERGLGLRYPGEPAADMFLWFYEWNMFEAMAPGQHTHGTYQLERSLDPAGRTAEIVSPALRLTARVVSDGAELAVTVTNRTAHSWPAIAGIIPCWNPGQVRDTNPSSPRPLNFNFSDPERRKSYFVSAAGLTPLVNREIHFNSRFRAAVDRASDQGTFVFSPKWPTSQDNAASGLLVRESEDGRWVTGIGWERFLSTQGHNPWSCLHACIRVGPLEPGESRTVRGRLFLFQGTKEECLARFRAAFPPN